LTLMCPRHGGVSTFSGEEGKVAMAQIVKPHRLPDRIRHGWEPDTAAERVATDGAAFGGGEEQPVGSGRVVGEVLIDDLGQPCGDRNGLAGGGEDPNTYDQRAARRPVPEATHPLRPGRCVRVPPTRLVPL